MWSSVAETGFVKYCSALCGLRGGAVCWGTALQGGRSRDRFPMVSLEFFIDVILPAPLLPWGSLSLLQKWVPGIFPGGNGGRCVGLTTLPPSCADCLQIWEPQLLEPSGPVHACNGIALSFYLYGIWNFQCGRFLRLCCCRYRTAVRVLWPSTLS